MRAGLKGGTLVGLLLLGRALPVGAQDDADARWRAKIAEEVRALTAGPAEAGLLSGAIVIVRGDEVVFEQAYGFANWELGAVNTTANRFGIASITKPMTDVAVHALADAGRLDLDAPVERYLPGFPRGPDGGVPTVRQLMTHEAGVPHRVTTTAEEMQPLTPADIVERVRKVGLLFEPGTRAEYSSAGYSTLARVVEVVEKKPFEAVMAERVFQPAGMNGATNETGLRLMPGRAQPYVLGSDGRRITVKTAPYKDLRFLTGAGSVYATPKDLVAFVRAIRAGVFGADAAAEMFAGEASSWNHWYGRTNGYEASVDVLKAKDVTFVFVSNLQSAANWQLRAQIQSVIAGASATPIPVPPPVVAPFEDPDSFVGSYGVADVALLDGALFRGDVEFYPIEGRRYYIPVSGSVMYFRRDAQGRVDAMITVRGSGQESVAMKR